MNIPFETTNIANFTKSKQTLLDIDKRITIKFLKETKTSRTYVNGLCDFMSAKDATDFSKILKKKLGTNVIVTENGFGFNGHHVEKIRELLLQTDIPPERIHVNI